LLIFVNNEHFVNSVTVGKVNADAARAGILSNLAKAIIRYFRLYRNEINVGHFEHLMCHKSSLR